MCEGKKPPMQKFRNNSCCRKRTMEAVEQVRAQTTVSGGKKRACPFQALLDRVDKAKLGECPPPVKKVKRLWRNYRRMKQGILPIWSMPIECLEFLRLCEEIIENEELHDAVAALFLALHEAGLLFHGDTNMLIAKVYNHRFNPVMQILDKISKDNDGHF
ncbi:hypothetical protein TTRE_0000905201 [Trichuris trichiura]|uniref:Uncharacterized protein n=1 Tax=Trichuris trichiura TaxID=36087 RepID=A0A077ZK13_TRITR|nr:hypothetical protein TTRE_0000905201 [Trichuris trichiura]